MKVVILCGGLGTRLREETEFRPKPMVNIGSRPILWHIMKIYAHFGHKEFILALGYKGEMIKEYFYNYEIMNNDFTMELGKPESMEIHASHNESGWKITLAETGERNLKGSRIKQVEKYIKDDTFMITYGDGVASIDIKKLIEFHRSHGKMVTLSGISPGSQFGELKIKDDQITSFQEKPETPSQESWVSGGYMVCNRKIFDYLSTDEDCDFEFGALETIAKKGELMVYKHVGFWACMDTLRDVEHLNKLWEKGEAKWKVWD
jgi:glucose-1-phosphate cytidylyltransferase